VANGTAFTGKLKKRGLPCEEQRGVRHFFLPGISNAFDFPPGISGFFG